jgi:endoglucanase
VTWSDHQGAAPNYTIDPAYISRVRQVIDWAIDDGLYVILDVHHDSWQWTKAMSTDHDKVLARFNSTWTQISTAFKNESAKLVFESINEPQFDNADAAMVSHYRRRGDPLPHHLQAWAHHRPIPPITDPQDLRL